MHDSIQKLEVMSTVTKEMLFEDYINAIELLDIMSKKTLSFALHILMIEKNRIAKYNEINSNHDYHEIDITKIKEKIDQINSQINKNVL